MQAVSIGGKLMMVPIKLIESVAASFGGGGDEFGAAADGEQQEQAAQSGAEKTRTTADYAGNLRSLAKRRFEGREIDASLWQRLPEPLAEYLQALSLSECEIIAGSKLNTLAAWLSTSKMDTLEGVRSPEDALRSVAVARPALVSGSPAAVNSFQARVSAALAKGRGAEEAPAMGRKLAA